MAIRNILLDTNAYTAFKKGLPSAVEILQHVPFIGISSIVGELLGGFSTGSREEKNCQELQLFLDSPRVKILFIDANTPKYYAQIY